MKKDPSRRQLHKVNKDPQDLQAARKQNVSLAINLELGPIMSRTSQELGTTPPPKKTTKPPAPPDRIFSITADLQQAVLDDDLKEIQILLTFFYFHVKTL